MLKILQVEQSNVKCKITMFSNYTCSYRCSSGSNTSITSVLITLKRNMAVRSSLKMHAIDIADMYKNKNTPNMCKKKLHQ